MTKNCPKCKENKLLEHFPPDKRTKNGKGSWCRICQGNARKDWYQRNKEKAKATVKKWVENNKERKRKTWRNYSKRNPEKMSKRVQKWQQENPEQFKNINMKYKYGITLEDYNKMLFNQNNKCAICSKSHSECKYGLDIDHCHKSGKVRALLCNRCNTSLGLLNESIEVFANCIEYLKKHKID